MYGAPTCGSIFRKELMIKEGGFNDELYPSSDWFFLCKFNKKYKVYKSVDVLGFYRVFENESLNPNTVHGFLNNKAIFIEYSNNANILIKFFHMYFSEEQNFLSVKWALKMLENGSFSNNIHFVCTKRNLRLKLYRFLRKIYNVTKIAFVSLLG